MANTDNGSGWFDSLPPDQQLLAARTLWGEGRGQPDVGLQGIANVIRNRTNSQGFPDDVAGVIQQPNQFSMWNQGDPNGPKAMAVDPSDPEMQRAYAALRTVGSAPDPTGGAVNYYNPSSASPAWGDQKAKDNDVMLGAHRFVGVGTPKDGSDQGIGGTGVTAYGDNTAPLTDGQSAIAQTFGAPGSQAPPKVPDPNASLDIDNYDGTFTRAEALAKKPDDDTTPSVAEWDAAAAKAAADGKVPLVTASASGTPASPSGLPPMDANGNIGEQAAPGETGGGALGTISRLGQGILNFSRSPQTNDFGNSLTRMGAALMARDNPSGAQAMLASIHNPLDDKMKQAQIDNYANNDTSQKADIVQAGKTPGFVTRVSYDKNGKASISQVPIAGYVAPPDTAPKVPPVMIKDFGNDDANFTNATDLAGRADKVLDALTTNKTSMSIVNQGGALIDNSANKSTESDRLVKEANTIIDRYVSYRLQQEHGTRGTQAQMAQARAQILPPGAQWDNGQMADALMRVREWTNGSMNTAKQANEQRIIANPSLDKDGAIMRRYSATANPVNSGWQATQDKVSAWQAQRDAANKSSAAGVSPVLQAFHASRPNPQPGPAPAPVAAPLPQGMLPPGQYDPNLP